MPDISHVPGSAAGRESGGPSLITWLEPGRIGGMARPGRTRAVFDDLSTVAQLGVSMIVSLTSEWMPPKDVIEALGLESVHVPIPDWQPPTLLQAVETCKIVAAAVSADRPVVFHCQAGRGRTGTMLAALLIWRDPDFDAAIGRVKTINPDWIETDAQMTFLKAFAAHCRVALADQSDYNPTAQINGLRPESR